MAAQRRRHAARAARCGSAPTPACSREGSLARAGSTARSKISERHRHRYEFNNAYREQLERARAASLSGVSPDGVAGRDDRARRPSVVPRLPVPPRVQVAAARLPSAVPGLHPRRARSGGAPRATRCRSAACARRAQLRRVSGDARRGRGRAGRRSAAARPLVLIAGPCVIESRDAALRHAERLRDIAARARRAVRLQGVLRQGQPHLARRSFRGAGLDEGLRDPRRGAARDRRAGAHRRARDASRSRRSPRSSTCCRCRRSSAGRPTSSLAVARAGQAGEREEGTVPRRRGRWGRVVEKARATGNQQLLVTERGVALRLQQPGRRHARAARSWPSSATRWSSTPRHSVQLPGGAGHARRAASAQFVRAAGARRGRGRRRRGVPGGARGSRPRAQRRRRRACALDDLPALLGAARRASIARRVTREARRGDAAERQRRRARRVLDVEMRRRSTAVRDRLDERFDARGRRAARVPRQGRRHRHRQVGHRLPQDRRDPRQHRHAGVLPARRRGAARRPRHARRAATWCSRCRTAARPTRSCACCRCASASACR